eukprot:SAG31_NODE_668_length_12945_cov_15.915849_7_plen_176_part_00
MPPPGGSGSSSGGVDVVTTTNPMFNDEAQLRPDEAQLRPDEVDETTVSQNLSRSLKISQNLSRSLKISQDLHSPLAEHEQRGSPLGELWLMLTAPGNAVAGVASALHVNIYLLALGLILSTQYLPVRRPPSPSSSARKGKGREGEGLRWDFRFYSYFILYPFILTYISSARKGKG